MPRGPDGILGNPTGSYGRLGDPRGWIIGDSMESEGVHQESDDDLWESSETVGNPRVGRGGSSGITLWGPWGSEGTPRNHIAAHGIPGKDSLGCLWIPSDHLG